jgi:hypothetical protein
LRQIRAWVFHVRWLALATTHSQLIREWDVQVNQAHAQVDLVLLVLVHQVLGQELLVLPVLEDLRELGPLVQAEQELQVEHQVLVVQAEDQELVVAVVAAEQLVLSVRADLEMLLRLESRKEQNVTSSNYVQRQA